VTQRRRLAGSLGAAALVLAAAGAFWLDRETTLSNLPPAVGSGAANAALPAGAGFDFYVLSLSWSPSYCAAEGEDASRQQCEAERPYGFIVHGLWPQYERGYPADCPTDWPDVPQETLRSLYDLVPSAGLIRHQWRKHGSCSGLSQEDYFGALRAARERVAIPGAYANPATPRELDPDAVETSFLADNAGLPADGIAVTCDRRYLREVRICLTRDLAFRGCPEVDRRACQLPEALMPAPGDAG
jgi:ribonuclease T2